MDVAHGAAGVGEVLLAHQDERPLGQPAGVDLPLGGRDLGVGAAEVDRPGAAGLLMSVLGAATLGGLRPAMVVAARSPRPAGRSRA
jgi:hypothetical protein